jgi:hypothetical protein
MNLTKYIKALLFIALFTASAYVYAYANTLLVLDMRNVPILPKHFRTTSDPLPNNINKGGLADLHIAGGSQFSKLALHKIVKRLGTNHITVIDLRQESHGFLDGNAITWYAPQDAGNKGLTDTQIEQREAQLLHELDLQEYATAYVILKKSPNGYIIKTKPVEFSVHNVSSEADLVTQSHLNYHRIYVQDFHAPNAQQIDRFIKIVKQLPPNQWIYFHCRAGVGRTTTFMVMYDMMRNAKKVSFDDILARQRALGGKELTQLPEPGSFKYTSAKERLNFLKQFYRYVRENKDGFATSWSTWSSIKRPYIS